MSHFTEFVCGYTPTIEELYEAPARVEDSLYILQILDTAGTDECGIIREEFYHQCDGYLLVFSVIDRFSLQEIKEISLSRNFSVQLLVPAMHTGNLSICRLYNKHLLQYSNSIIHLERADTNLKLDLELEPNLKEDMHSWYQVLNANSQPLQLITTADKSTHTIRITTLTNLCAEVAQEYISDAVQVQFDWSKWTWTRVVTLIGLGLDQVLLESNFKLMLWIQ
ncbi:Ras protein [Oopsacas minuta]|uniref:Ras protein n=1 Tax=Oopsacas minuta TaxID=111878 RepID=A0AAV7JBG7_9METZ|nr:Ras protein [Oopsacas minuta]